MINNGKKLNRIVAMAVFAVLFLCLIAFFGIQSDVPAHATEPEQTYNIHSATEFSDYAKAYALGDRNPKDVLNISISSGNEIVDDTFISLGTAARPFAGTINIPTAGIDTFRLSNCPLFNYVSTEMRVTGSGVIKIIRERENETPAAGVLTSGALFANHVIKGSTAASWSVSLLPYSGEGTAATEYAGVLGDIADECNVTVTFTNTSNLSVTGSGDTGLICGSLGEDASLTVTTAGSGGTFTVTGTGNVGGIVGKMQEGASLVLASNNLTRISSVVSSGGYAGGVVGDAIYSTVTVGGGVSGYALSSSVTGTTGAGGIFGHYKTNIANETFALTKYAYSSPITLSSTGSTGGIFGYLESESETFTFDGDAADTSGKHFSFVLSGGSNRGGVCGKYSSDDLTHSLYVTKVYFTVNGGVNDSAACLIGRVTNAPAYINIKVVYADASSATKAGLIAEVGNGGSFVDVKDVTVSGTFNYGLIGSMPKGVLRLKHNAFFSSYTQYSGESSSLIVGTRGQTLIYAAPDMEEATTTWTLRRNVYNSIDDVGTWGEVLRADGTVLNESDLFTVDMTAHTVTVKGAYTTMSTVTQLALTALNIQLNEGGVGALQFTSGSVNTSATLLAADLVIGADLSFAGTGLTGFARDDGNNADFTGTLDGCSHTVTLAIGERYGYQGNGSALDSDSKQGNIYRHKYNGLFAEINNASVSDLTLAGTIYVNQRIYREDTDDCRVGGLAAEAKGTVSLDSVTASFTFIYRAAVADAKLSFGGCIGVATGTSLVISAEDCTFIPTMTELTASNVGRGGSAYVGGFIGVVRKGGTNSPTQSVTATNCDLGLNYTKTVNTARESTFGGVIGQIADISYVKDNRTVTLDTVTVAINATGTAAGGNFGGILGYEWLTCDVTLDGVTVDATIVATGSTASYGGLVKTATGMWNVQSIELNTCNYTLPNNGSSFGFVANKAYKSSCGLYLEVNDASGEYDIDALTFTSDPNFASFDELVNNSVGSGSDVTKNGNSIISVTTSGNVINTSGNNTYLNKTSYGQSKGKINANTRYYYNVAYARSNVATAKYKFLIWSIKTYAHGSLSAWFNASSPLSGSLDMRGLSYYPIDLGGTVAFNTVTIILDNNLTENAVDLAYTGDADHLRTTRTSGNQHYLMHTALFRDVTGTLNVSGATLQGNVPKLSDSFCGYLVAGTVGNKDDTRAKCNLASVTVDGVFVSDDGDHFTDDTDYVPLLINKIGKNSTLDWAGAVQSTSSYASYGTNGYYAGSSLIGDVGDTTARAIYLTFTGMAFDGRDAHTSIGNLDTAYGTTQAIFSRATLLNSFRYFAESSGRYNFTLSEDFESAVSAIHRVTYGKEITSSVENAGKQKKYDSSNFFVHPTDYSSATEYDFSTGFLPYVYVAYNTSVSERSHELSVNISFNSVISGCGKYGDPFIVDDDNKLPIISVIISGGSASGAMLYLPSDLTSYDYTGTSYTKYLYSYDTLSSEFVSDDVGASSFTLAQVRQYLAGTYIVVTKDVTLPKDYVSLGTTADPEYAFRGVIIGRGNPVVTNNSPNPLIYSSNGCVVQGITVDVDVDVDGSDEIELAAPAGNGTYAYSSGIQSYGAVIGQIMGGDTFIDNVRVTFTGATFNVTEASSCYARLTPIGGYVGVLVNGGLIFRNMSSSDVGLTSATYAPVANAGYLYVNPIIGRVIAGYAFNETSAYHTTEATVTLKNGEKNYTISDLSLSSGKLSVGYSSSQFTVTVPDGQAMFVLGAIVNSGAASASYSASVANAYPEMTAFWSAYRRYTATRAGATYSAVGEAGFASDQDYTGYAVNDFYTENSAYAGDVSYTPYIIRAYTTKSGSVYLARCISTQKTTKVVISGNCDVAQGFRGIGSIYYLNDLVHLGVQQVTGQVGSTTSSYTVTLHMRYLEYNHKYVSSYIAEAESASPNSTAGFGLFTVLEMSSASSTNCIKYLTLAGSVFYDVYKIDGGNVAYNFAYYKNSSAYDRTEANGITGGDTDDAVQRRTLLSVGGLAGFAKTHFYIKNVTFNDLSVEGAKAAGGLIGFVHLAKSNQSVATIAYDNADVTNAGYVNVVAGLQAGGLIGRSYRANLVITGAGGSGTDIIIKNVESKNQNPNEEGMYYFANVSTGVGGLVGTLWGQDGDGHKNNTPVLTPATSINVKKFHISDINVVRGSEAANVRVNNDGDTKNNYAGGFIGSAHNSWINLTRCSISGVNVTANTAGGFVGKMTQKYYLELYNCVADGQNKSAAISGTRYAGGAVGWVIGRDTIYFQLRDLTVTNYVIQSTATTQVQAGAGGAVGYTQGNNIDVSSGANYTCQFNNITVLGCDIKSNYTNKTDNYLKFKCGTGGIIGVIDTINVSAGAIPDESKRTANNKYKFSGYNILVKNCTFTHKNGGSTDDNTSASNRRIGDIVGNNAVESPIKFVAVSVQNATYCGKHVGFYNTDSDNYGTDGYLVLADYHGVMLNEEFSHIDVPDSSSTLSEIEDAYLNVQYDDCNAFGVVLQDSGATTDLSRHTSAIVYDATLADFSELAALFATLKGKYPVSDSFNKWIPTSGTAAYAAYSDFFDKVKEMYDGANSAIANNVIHNIASGAVIGINKPYLIVPQDTAYTYDNFKTVISRLFGYDSVSTFDTYAANIVTAYRAFSSVSANTPANNRLHFDGAIFADNKSFILPFVFKNELDNAVIGCVISDNAGVMSIWINSVADAFSAANFNNAHALTEAVTVEVYGRCFLFETHDVEAASPFVTVNPSITIGGVNITGDGVASTVNTLPIQNIISDGVAGRYGYAASAYYNGSSGANNLATFTANSSNLVMFTSEVSGYLGTDFPVLIVDDITRENTHKMINSYLRLLTNTTHDFGVDVSGVYDVVIYKMVYNDGVFLPSTTGVSLRRSDGQFYITNNLFDSGKMQFSLIDVRFRDPSGTVRSGESETRYVYHLYVPVFVKKVLTYSFDIAVQGGTNYLSGRYVDKFGDAMIENVGTPVTVFFRYTYSRTLSEWEDAINAGESVHRNYDKKLYLYKANTNDVLKSFPSDTVLVLVDANRGGKPYYATIGTALVGNVLNLTAFRENMTSAGVFSGAYFSPVNLEDMMTKSVTTLGGGADRLVQCAEGAASVVVAGQGYRLATEEELADGTITKYSVTLSGSEFVERYYLSIFTESNVVNDALFHYYLITTPSSFAETDYPSKITDTGAHTMVHLVMGKIFFHDDLEVSSDSTLHTDVISSENNALTVRLTSVLGLNDDLDEEIKANMQTLISAAHVYQSFLVYLNRREGSEVIKAIIGDPTAAGSYSVDYVLNGSADTASTAYSSSNVRLTQNHVEVVTGDLSANFATGNKFEINSTVTLTYDNAGLMAQFPGRGASTPDNGVTISASSNVAFSTEGTTYSKNTVGADETPPISYYSEADPEVATLSLNALGDQEGDFTPLGINALNNGNLNYAEFDVLAVIDASAIEEQIANYSAVKVMVKLMQKGADGSYGSPLDVSDYFTVTFDGVATPTDRDTYYEATILSSNQNLVDNGAEITLPTMTFSVKTGAAFESAGKTYANYRIVVETVILDEESEEISASHVSNYIVYTNAKVIPFFIG